MIAYTPSKELLSAVLNSTVHFTNQIKCADNELRISFTNERFSGTKNYNIYELAHKVKEWAVKQHKENKENNNGNHFYLNHFGSTLVGFFENYQAEIGYRGTDRDGDWADLQIIFTERTEPEAIFRAGEWILAQGANNE